MSDSSGPEAEPGPPAGEPALKTVAMPGDANPNGDIFGGWVMAQMDLAGAVPAVRRAKGRVATVAVEGMRFHKPVFIGDLVSCHAELVSVGRSSMTVRVETWAERRIVQERVKVTEGIFTYVAIDDAGRKRPLPGV
jgi:acyl-CoA thioesterase YciA